MTEPLLGLPPGLFVGKVKKSIVDLVLPEVESALKDADFLEIGFQADEAFRFEDGEAQLTPSRTTLADLPTLYDLLEAAVLQVPWPQLKSSPAVALQKDTLNVVIRRRGRDSPKESPGLFAEPIWSCVLRSSGSGDEFKHPNNPSASWHLEDEESGSVYLSTGKVRYDWDRVSECDHSITVTWRWFLDDHLQWCKYGDAEQRLWASVFVAALRGRNAPQHLVLDFVTVWDQLVLGVASRGAGKMRIFTGRGDVCGPQMQVEASSGALKDGEALMQGHPADAGVPQEVEKDILACVDEVRHSAQCRDLSHKTPQKNIDTILCLQSIWAAAGAAVAPVVESMGRSASRERLASRSQDGGQDVAILKARRRKRREGDDAAEGKELRKKRHRAVLEPGRSRHRDEARPHQVQLRTRENTAHSRPWSRSPSANGDDRRTAAAAAALGSGSEFQKSDQDGGDPQRPRRKIRRSEKLRQKSEAEPNEQQALKKKRRRGEAPQNDDTAEGELTLLDEINHMYTTHNPAKLKDLPVILKKYEGAEQKLYVALCKKYGTEPKTRFKAKEHDKAKATTTAKAPAPAAPKRGFAKKASASAPPASLAKAPKKRISNHPSKFPLIRNGLPGCAGSWPYANLSYEPNAMSSDDSDNDVRPSSGAPPEASPFDPSPFAVREKPTPGSAVNDGLMERYRSLLEPRIAQPPGPPRAPAAERQ